MSIREQIKAIKDCLTAQGWKYVSVKHLDTNHYNRTIKYFEVRHSLSKKENPFVYEIVVTNLGIQSVKTKNILFIDTINALHKALGGK